MSGDFLTMEPDLWGSEAAQLPGTSTPYSVLMTHTHTPLSTTTEANDIRSWLMGIVLKRATEGFGNGGFTSAFVAALSVVIVSELGDKTFFIAAIMAMRHPRALVFSGAITALFFMTALSAAFGWIATVIPRAYTYYASAALFAIFGIKMLRDGWKMDPNEGLEELDEVQADLRRKDDMYEKESAQLNVEEGNATALIKRGWWRIVAQAATLTFLAEWGDRSQLATVVLGAREDVRGVIVGGTLGHAACTGLAVMGGRMVAQRISVRTVTLIGGVVFLLFALSALFIDPGD